MEKNTRERVLSTINDVVGILAVENIDEIMSQLNPNLSNANFWP